LRRAPAHVSQSPRELAWPRCRGSDRPFAADAEDARPPTAPSLRWPATLALYDLVFGLIAYAVSDFLLED
jgi:hypothetical protein